MFLKIKKMFLIWCIPISCETAEASLVLVILRKPANQTILGKGTHLATRWDVTMVITCYRNSTLAGQSHFPS